MGFNRRNFVENNLGKLTHGIFLRGLNLRNGFSPVHTAKSTRPHRPVNQRERGSLDGY